MGIFATLIDIIIPSRCVISGEVVASQGTVSPKAWATLSFITAPFCQACGFPFEFEAGSMAGEVLCAGCVKERPVFEKARSALVYNDASRDLILGFKHGDKIHAVATMTPWLKLAGAELWEEADILVPVPLNRWRLLRRRYNQAAIMARALGRAVQKDSVVDGLIRTRRTKSQGHMKPAQRAGNVKDAFAVKDTHAQMIVGKIVVLVDDVYTTGATVKECTKALLQGGAKKVFVLSLARVVRPEQF